jgi:ABC-type Zn uptake system ZnuABC Zn-binding protein ZnuA
VIRRTAVLIVILCLVGAIPGAAAGETLKVGASFAIIADFAQQVGGDQVEVVSLVPALADPHSWEPTPQDARAVAAFDILFVNGEGYEEWLWDLVSSASSPGLPIVELSVGLEPLPGPSHSVHHHAHDPHFWLSVPNAVHYVERITLALMELDPAHAQAYRERANAYQEQLWELDRWLLDELALIPEENRMLVTYHNAFAYFAERYGFTTAEFLVNHPDREPTAQDMVNLIRLLRGVSRPVVFAEPQFGVGQRYVKSIAGEIGGEVHVLYSATLTSEIPSYIDLMRYNGQVLLEALR